MTSFEIKIKQPIGGNVSLDNPISSEGASSTEGEKARVMSAVAPEMILPHQVTMYADNVFYGFTDNNIGKIDDSSGSFKSGELNKVTDLLEGSSGLVQKCSLNDIMFLVMLMMTKSAADQRQSRYEDIAAKKVVAQKTADTVYELKMAEAKTTYEAEKKQAILQIAMGSVQVVIGCISVVSGGVAVLGEIPKIASKISSVVTGTFRAMQLVANATSSISTIAQGIVQIDIAKQQRKSSFIASEASLNSALFDFNMKQLENMQSSYSTSNRNIQNAINTIKEVLQQTQSTRLNISRNI